MIEIDPESLPVRARLLRVPDCVVTVEQPYDRTRFVVTFDDGSREVCHPNELLPNFN